MTKIIFLLPPSEWKNSKNKYSLESLNFKFEKPKNIAKNVTEKDLKCKWDRFLEALELNKNINNSETIESIKRYSWVMFNAIDYDWMNTNQKYFFEENFLILSGMYGIVKPLDKIWNYKLPIETKGLLEFWWTKVLEKINSLKPNFVVNLLPISYSKLIFWKNKKEEILFKQKRKFKIININFLKENWNKISHWVKKIKWEWIKNICEKHFVDYNDFWGKIMEENNWIININIYEK